RQDGARRRREALARLQASLYAAIREQGRRRRFSTEAVIHAMADDSSPDAAVVSLRGVGKTFPNRVVALRDATFDIGEREFVSLLGPSGCGKSTALRIIAGLTEASTGEVTWRDRAAQGASGEIGFVFQEPTLMPWASVANNVYLPLRLAGADRASSMPRIREA